MKKQGNVLRRVLGMVVVVLLVCALPMSVMAAGSDKDTYKDSSENYFFAGEDAKAKNGTFFGGFGAGETVVAEGAAFGDALCVAGRDVRITDSSVGSSIFAAGYDVQINAATVAGNIIAAGNRVITNVDTVSKGVLVTGRELQFNGTSESLLASGQTIELNGTVNGDVNVTAEKVIIGKDAKIEGTLKVSATEKPVVPEGAEVGSVKFEKVETERQVMEKTVEDADALKTKIIVGVILVITMTLMGFVLSWLFSRRVQDAVQVLKAHPVLIFLTGILGLIATPLLAVLISITLVAIPVALLILLGYVLTICLSVVIMGAVLGRLVLRRVNPVLASVLGVVFFEILRRLPYVGIGIAIIAVIFSMGLMIQTIWRTRSVEDMDEDYEEYEDDDEDDNGDDEVEDDRSDDDEVVEKETLPVVEEKKEENEEEFFDEDFEEDEEGFDSLWDSEID